MKRMLLVITMVLALTGTSAGYEQKSSPIGDASLPGNKPRSSEALLKTIIVENYYPYTFLNEKGVPDGFSVDIIQAVTNIMGMGIVIQTGPWDKAVKALETGQIDLLPMMAYSKERDRVFDFSVPHTIGYDAVFTRKGSVKTRSIEDLRGKTIIVMNKDTAHDYLRSIGMAEQAKLVLVDSLPDALRLLSAGKGDAALMPKLVGLIHIKNLGLTNLEESYVVIDTYNRPFSIAVKSGNQALLERLSQGLSIIKDTGQYNTIYAKWFGAIDPPGISVKTVIKYIAAVIGVFSVIGLLLLFWSFSLKKQVAQRTIKLEKEIAERIQAEEKLLKSEGRYRLLVETANEGIWAMDGDHITTYVNQAMAHMLGYEPSEILGKKVEDFFFPDDTAFHNERMRKRHAGEDEVYERRFRRQNGTPLWTLVSAKVFQDNQGHFGGSFAMFTDITARKLAEENLIISEDKFRKIYNHSPVMATISNIDDGSYIDANEQFLKVSGFNREEVIGRTSVELGWIHPDDRNNLIEVLKKQGRIMGMELRLLSKDKREIICLFNGEIISIGGQQRLLSIAQDITDRKQAEEAIKASLKEKEVLLKEIQHRVKNNLLTISGILALQSEQLKDNESKDAFTTSMNRINAMTKIHTRLYQSDNYSLIPLKGYMEELLGELSRSYGFPHENLIIDIQDISIDINTAIPAGLIVNELVSNAMKHAFPDGKKGQITITLSSENAHSILTISDNGIGLPSSIDFRNTESVGLSLFKQLVEQINGTIELLRDKGTQFIITFSID